MFKWYFSTVDGITIKVLKLQYFNNFFGISSSI